MDLVLEMRKELDGLEKELRCVICLETFHRPNTLPCAHSFCQDCIVRALDSGKGCPICKIPAMKRALIINVGLNNIVEHYDHLKALCDALVAQRQSLATTKAIPKQQNVLVLDTQRTPSAPSAPQTQILIGRFSSAAETKDIMAPPPPKRRSTPSIAPSPIAVNPDNVLRAMKQIQNADRIISELDKMIEAQKQIEQKIQDESDDNLLGGSIGSSFVVPSGSFSSLPPAAQPRDSLLSSTASIFHMEQQDMEKVPENRAAKNAAPDQGVIFIDLDATEYNGTAPTAPHHGINNDDDEDFQQTRPVTAPTKNTKKRGRSKRELSALLADQEPFVADNSVGRARTRPPTGTSASSRRRSRSNDSPRGRVQVPSRNHRSDDSEEYGDENDDDSDHYVAASFKKQRGGGGAARFEDDDADPDATQRPPFVIVGTCLSSDDMEYLEKAARALGASVCKSFDRNDITHVVTQAIGENLSKRSVKFLQGILQHCWIVNMSWVKQSSLNKSWLPEAKYEIKGDNKNSASDCLLLTALGAMLTVFLSDMGGPSQSRMHGASAPRLFKDYRIVLVGNFNAPTKTEMEQLLTWAGAEALLRIPRESDRKKKDKMYFVVDAEASDAEDTLDTLERIESRFVLRHDWILDSLAQYKVLSTPEYQIRYEDNDYDD